MRTCVSVGRSSIYEVQRAYPSARLEISCRSESTISNNKDTSAALSSLLLISCWILFSRSDNTEYTDIFTIYTLKYSTYYSCKEILQCHWCCQYLFLSLLHLLLRIRINNKSESTNTTLYLSEFVLHLFLHLLHLLYDVLQLCFSFTLNRLIQVFLL